MKSKTVTLIGVNFYPEDTAIGLYSSDMAKYLTNKGFQVNAVTGFPYYPQWEIKEEYKRKGPFLKEKLLGINIYRYKQYVPKSPSFLKRIIHIIDFTFGSIINLFKIKETDIIIAIVPFTSSMLLGWLLKKKCKAKLWVHVQDFEFDAALQTGLTEGETKGLKKIIFSVLFKLERWLFSKADKASSISYTMLDKLKTKLKDQNKITYLPNWIDAEKINPEKSTQHNYLKSDKFKILYSGNIGDKQNWSFFMSFIEELDSEIFEVIIVGDGSKKQWLINETKDYHFVKHYAPVPFEDLASLLCSADMHFLFQKEDVIDTLMPSKLLGMMASSKPSIISGNKKSEVKKVLEESEAGYYIEDLDLQKTIVILKRLQEDKDLRMKIGVKARGYVKQRFSKDSILENLYNELQAL